MAAREGAWPAEGQGAAGTSPAAGRSGPAAMPRAVGGTPAASGSGAAPTLRAAGGPRPPAGPGQQGAGSPVSAAGSSAGSGGHSGRLARLNTGALIYGTIVSAAALAVGAVRGETAHGLIEAMTATLVIYWLAHIYTATVSRRPGTTVPLRQRIRAAARREAPILLGGLPAIAVVVGQALAGATLWVIDLSAVGTAIGVLAIDGLLAGLQAGVKGWRLGAEAGSAAVFGGLLAILLIVLHVR